jgi:Ser/Thr protein kinase RdoA (MazF antagonist)
VDDDHDVGYADVGDAEEAVRQAWHGYGDPRRIVRIAETSSNVSTNRVFRVLLDDRTQLIVKVSAYGSYFLFAEDHDRLYRVTQLLADTRFAGLLANVLGRDGRAYTWYDGRRWAAFYEEVPRGEQLPKVLTERQIDRFAQEMAEFHLACAAVAARIPPLSYSMKSNAIELLDLLASPFAPRNFGLPPELIGTLWRHTHELLCSLERLHYDEWPKMPVLVDWNLGNFSVQYGSDQPDDFRLFTRWDYDWFRIESRVVDFYFLSRVSSRTGDRTEFTYQCHTLVEPRFVRFVAAYHRTFPLSEDEVRFLPEAYRFFLLNYVVRVGSKFFRPELCDRFRRDAARWYLPELERLDIRPLLRAIGA